MRALFHAGMAVSMLLVASTAQAGGAAQAGGTPRLYGRWTTTEPAKAFTKRGAEYRQFDIAPCGKDFCGVSVGPKGVCGPVLFRFLTKHIKDWMLTGHGKWGAQKMNLGLEINEIESSGRYELLLGLGDSGYALESRESSMPKFTATYRPAGPASCTTR